MEQKIDLDLRTILVIVMVITSLSVIFQNLLMQTALIFVSIILLLLINPGKKKFTRIMHRLKNILKIVLTLMVFQILFRQEGEIFWQWKIIKITSSGLNYGIISSLRFFLIIIISGLLIDISFDKYLLALRGWKISYEISFIIASVIHFIPLFSKQFRLSMEALSLREININDLPLRKRPKAYLSLLFPIIARAMQTVKYRAISMELRGFRLFPDRTYLYKKKLRWFDYCIQFGIILSFGLILCFYYLV